MSLQYFKLPTEETPNISYTATLNGVDYKFTFKYSTRNSSWFLTISDVQDIVLVSNIKLVPHIGLLSPFVTNTLPQGILTLVSDSSYESPPAITLENLSTDFTLVYDDGE